MIRFSVLLCLALVVAGCSTPEEPANKLERANVLPLALDDSYQFRKVQQINYDNTKIQPLTTSEAANFERMRTYWGATQSHEYADRNGHYYNFFWRAKVPSDVTVRFEYRQAGLSNHVMAQERYYPGVRGTRKSSFQVTGDDYLENGRVTSWRILLIVDGKIVALRQSFMWR
ncbi:MAG: hypothetical protein IAE94_02375 [Chthoniobacterales bacterium]|nr:hypothetical protein [Chthoniobacterales bacterium]